MKTCSKCKKTKPYMEFHTKGRTYKAVSEAAQYRSMCKVCHKDVMKKYSQKCIAYLQSLKTACVLCGEDRPHCLDFHHKNPKEKEFTVGTIAQLRPERIGAEIAKCVVLCSNCHRHEHHLLKQGETQLEEVPCEC